MVVQYGEHSALLRREVTGENRDVGPRLNCSPLHGRQRFPLPVQLPMLFSYIAKHSSFLSSSSLFSPVLTVPLPIQLTRSPYLSRRLSQLVCPVPFLPSRCSPTLVTWAPTARNPTSAVKTVRRSINQPPANRA